MTIQAQYTRALKGQATARECLRKFPGNDMHLDHWAMRLVFWIDEAKRLRRHAEEDGHSFHEID